MASFLVGRYEITIFDPPAPLSTRRETGFKLLVFDRQGKTVLREYDRMTYGISERVIAAAHPLTGCVGMTFNARPDLVELIGGEVVQAFADDGDGLKAIFYGALIGGWTGKPQESAVSYTADGRVLLNARTGDEAVYQAVDVAEAARDLVFRRRHPALKYRAADFPATGIILTEPYSAAALPLGEALAELAARAAEAGAEVGQGVDESGYVFFRANTDELTVNYYEGIFRDLPTATPKGIVTAVHWAVFGTPSIDSWAGGYQPTTLTYLSIPEPDLHEAWGYVAHEATPESAWIAVSGSAVTSAGFTAPENAVDENPATAATRTGTGTPYLQLANADPWVFGIRLFYQLSDDAPAVKLRVTPRHEFAASGKYYEVELPKSTDDKPVDVYLPRPALQFQGSFLHFETFRITSPPGGTFKLVTAHLLRLDTDRLDAVTTLKLSVPSQRPTQITPLRDTPTGPRSYLGPVTKTVFIPDTPTGDRRGVVAGVRRGWTQDGGIEMVIDLETQAGDETSLLLDEVEQAAQDALRLSEVKAAARRKL